MSKVLVQYFEGEAYVGSRYADRAWQGAAYITDYPYWPHTAYFCGQCGEVWAREISQGVGTPRGWALIHRPCVEHGGGEFLLNTDLDSADRDLLRRELLVILTKEESCE